MGPSKEGVLFVPCLGRADATQGPRAEISTPPLGVGSAGALCAGEPRPQGRGAGAAAGRARRPVGEERRRGCCGDRRSAVAETHPRPHGQSPRPGLML